MAGDGQQAFVAGPNLDGHVPNLEKPTPGLDMDTQYVKPREGDTIKLKQFPKLGNSFDAWQDHLRDAACACSAFGQSAFRWILEVEKEGAKYEDFQNPVNFVQLDQKLNAALNDRIPGDTHMLRQRINKKRRDERLQHQRNIAGRQMRFMVYEWFKVAEKTKTW